MADLTADQDIRILGKAYTERFLLETTGAQTVYRGQPIMIDQTLDATGPVLAWVDANVAVDDVFMGIAVAGVSVGAGDPETTEVECYVGPTIVGFPNNVPLVDGLDVGKLVYKSDSKLLTLTATVNPELGYLWCVRDGYAYVLLETPKICVNV